MLTHGHKGGQTFTVREPQIQQDQIHTAIVKRLQSRTQAAMYGSRLGLVRTEPPRFGAPLQAHDAGVVSMDSMRRLKSTGRVGHA